MKTIIAGSRDFTDWPRFCLIMNELNQNISEVISGCARGVDAMGERWARKGGIPLKRFSAEWDRFGRNAGLIRNREMVDYGELLIALWDGKSKGTKHIIKTAKREGLQTIVVSVCLT